MKFATTVMVVSALVIAPPAPAGESNIPNGLTHSDWSGIRAAYEANRHAVFPVGAEWHARNPAQQWKVRFDGRGFEATPQAGDWSWGLELVSFGREGAMQDVDIPRCIDSQGGRVSYEWDDSLTEWFINDGRGLEHGFTVQQPPPRREEARRFTELQFTLAVRGDLFQQVSAGGQSISFVDKNGAAALTYSGLKVFDADGVALHSWFEAIQPTDQSAPIRLFVHDAGARYPLTIDPIAQQAYLKASNNNADDGFGWSVAVSGNTVVIGAAFEDSPATGVNGDGSGNSANGAGAAYVFVRNGSVWSQQAYLKASNTNALDRFGWSVAISGDTVVVGADLERSNATGVNGNQNDNSIFSAGAAYVFVRSGATWTQQAYLKASNPGLLHEFGAKVAISGDTIAIGADGEGGSASGINGNQSDQSQGSSGAVYVFRRNGSTWAQEAYIKATNNSIPYNIGVSDGFGGALALSGDTLVVGARGEDSDATGVNGQQYNDNAMDSGAAYVFIRNGTTWAQQAYLKASNTETTDEFGISVCLDGDTVAIGANSENSAATGIDGDQSNNSAPSAGAVYVFVRSDSSWSQQAYIKGSNTEANDLFGSSVAVAGEYMVVGAWRESSSATGINGNQSDNSAPDSGAAYFFGRSEDLWSQLFYLKASNTGANDRFGLALGLSNEILVAGARLEDSNANVINGDQSNNSNPSSGAAYVFSICPGTAGDLNCSCIANADDLAALLLSLIDPDGHASAYPGCLQNGDMNSDGLVNGADIQGFVGFLVP